MDNEVIKNEENIKKNDNNSLANFDTLDNSDNIYGGTFHERDSLSENNIVSEIEKSFLDYSMSVIASRA